MKTWKIRSSNHASARSLADALDIPFLVYKGNNMSHDKPPFDSKWMFYIAH